MSEFPEARQPEDAVEPHEPLTIDAPRGSAGLERGSIRGESRVTASPEARAEIEAVLSTLRQWLLEAEQWRYALVAPDEAATDADANVDLHTLLGELVALKQEVHLETRAGRSTREDLLKAVGEFHQGIDEVQQSAQKLLDPLVRERDRLREEAVGRLESQERLWTELLLDVREALARGEETSVQANRRLGWRKWFLPKGLFEGLQEGYGLALRRIDAALESRGVRPIECLGQRVDPERMRVVDLVERDDLEEGTVAEVVRNGYACGNRIIRYAEVRAVTRNKQMEDS